MYSILPLRLLDVAHMMEDSLPDGCSTGDIHFDRPKVVEWLNKVFRKDVNSLESALLETGQFTFGPTPRPPFFPVRPVEDRLGKRIDSRDSSASSRSRQPGSKFLEKDMRKSSTPQSSVVSSFVMVDEGNEIKSLAEMSGETSKARYLETVMNLELEELACRRELMEILELKILSHEELSSHYCVDWLKKGPWRRRI